MSAFPVDRQVPAVIVNGRGCLLDPHKKVWADRRSGERLHLIKKLRADSGRGKAAHPLHHFRAHRRDGDRPHLIENLGADP